MSLDKGALDRRCPPDPDVPADPTLMTDDQLIRAAGFRVDSRPTPKLEDTIWRIGDATFSHSEALKVALRRVKKKELAGGLGKSKQQK